MSQLPEIWGGFECTVNRVGDVYHDQILKTGHHTRPGDLELLERLGVKAVRYPVLWERCRRDDGSFDFSWSDERLGRLRELGIRVIVGLVHHGSGPRGVDLLNPAFASGLEEFAGRVAERYPWVQAYTPVNEPLTTARFSALYGHWYPHRSDARSFVRALLVQTQATVRAMRAVRRRVPTAELVQTEDFGSVFSTPQLKYQADFENQRRWLSFDLLFGMVDRRHPMRPYLVQHGANERELDELVIEPCPADLVGVNYYVTSDRFLDDRCHRYPAELCGGNGRDAYVDTEAVRARREGIVGHATVLKDAWLRYGAPVAVTEAHLGCTVDEQIRWLDEAWRGAIAARASGAEVRALTVWSLLGAFDWDSLVVQSRGHYEPGAFEVGEGGVKETALARFVRDLAQHGAANHPALSQPGWWRRRERLHAQLREEGGRVSCIEA